MTINLFQCIIFSIFSKITGPPKTMNPKVKMIDRLIRDQVKLFPDFPHNDDGLREVITQVVTGKPGRRMAKLYQVPG